MRARLASWHTSSKSKPARNRCAESIRLITATTGLHQEKFQRPRSRIEMTEQKILTKHPLGKSGKNIHKQKYETLKKTILSALRNKELTHTELFKQLNKKLKGKFSGNISWYGETVKLDLEARKLIERTSSKPQKYRLRKR